jgi:arginine:pyruvate transaminase
MRFAEITERLAHLGGAKWDVHSRARRMVAEGREVIELTIGEPDVSTPGALIDVAAAAMRSGRTGYSNGRGEPALLCALARRYSQRSGRTIGANQIICLPGTQTSLYAVLNALLQPGDEILVGDPMYATYEGLIAATGAAMVPVPLRPETGFRMQAADVADRITPRSRVLFLNSPHNPTGAVLRAADIAALGDLAIRHDLWIVCDEVYEELVFDGARFLSPLSEARLAERVVVVSSISKSHAAPGFRSGWCVGSAEFAARVLPLAETLLFGNQPFIADMTAAAVAEPSPVAADMARRFAARADLVRARLDGVAGLEVNHPEAGMFVLVDVRATGQSGTAFALGLLEGAGVAVMPGESFGNSLAGWVRLSLTQPDAVLEVACARIAAHVGARSEKASA